MNEYDVGDGARSRWPYLVAGCAVVAGIALFAVRSAVGHAQAGARSQPAAGYWIREAVMYQRNSRIANSSLRRASVRTWYRIETADDPPAEFEEEAEPQDQARIEVWPGTVPPQPGSTSNKYKLKQSLKPHETYSFMTGAEYTFPPDGHQLAFEVPDWMLGPAQDWTGWANREDEIDELTIVLESDEDDIWDPVGHDVTIGDPLPVGRKPAELSVETVEHNTRKVFTLRAKHVTPGHYVGIVWFRQPAAARVSATRER